MSSRIFSEIMDVPEAYLLLDEVKAALDKERQRRIQFYNDITEQEKIEFINGKIVVHSPVKKRHNMATGLLYTLLSVYTRRNGLGFVGIEKVMIALTRNDYEPDLVYFRKDKTDTFTEDQTLFPVPDFIVEVLSPSTEERDRGIKFRDYQAHGVEEYWILDPENETLEQYHLVGKEYQLILKSSGTDVESFVIEGFKIPIKAVFDDLENLKVFRDL